jgi:hypothetical protein
VFRWHRVVFTGITVTFSVPVFVISFLVACLAVAVFALLPRFLARRGAGGLDFQRQWSENQFRFEDSVRSYEDLIDTHARRRR